MQSAWLFAILLLLLVFMRSIVYQFSKWNLIQSISIGNDSDFDWIVPFFFYHCSDLVFLMCSVRLYSVWNLYWEKKVHRIFLFCRLRAGDNMLDNFTSESHFLVLKDPSACQYTTCIIQVIIIPCINHKISPHPQPPLQAWSMRTQSY